MKSARRASLALALLGACVGCSSGSTSGAHPDGGGSPDGSGHPGDSAGSPEAAQADARDAPGAQDAPGDRDAGPGLAWYPGNYALLFVEGPSSMEESALATFLASAQAPDFQGVQLPYAWADFEMAEGEYGTGFAGLDADLKTLSAAGKKLIIQAQYKEFGTRDAVPAYMLASGPWCVTLPDAGGQACGQYHTSNAIMPMLWQKGTSDRLQAWLTAMAAHVAASPLRSTVAGFVLPETAVGEGKVRYADVGYTADAYLLALEGDIAALIAAAPGIPVIQYINVFSAYPPKAGTSDATYLTQLAEWARTHPPAGIGCPDIVPGSWGGFSVPAGYGVLLDGGYQGVLPYNVSIQTTDYEAPRATTVDASYALATGAASKGMAASFVNWQSPSPPTAQFSFAAAASYVHAHPNPNTAVPTW